MRINVAVVLGATALFRGAYAGSVDSCTLQRDCIKYSVDEEPSTSCSAACQFRVCMTLNTTEPSCTKEGPVSHVCMADGGAESTTCDPDYWTTNIESGLNFREVGTQCQIVSPGENATFVIKDGSQCSDSYDDGVARCYDGPQVGEQSCSRSGNECFWKIQAPSESSCSSSTPAPTPGPTPGPATVTGDPHFRTWAGNLYDFHGICDLVLLHNPGFEEGLGLDIHVRTKQLKQFSYVSSAALRIGKDVLEIMENAYWINKKGHFITGNGIINFISGYPISYEQVNSKQNKFIVDLGDDKAITMTTFKKIVRVDIVGATEESFGTSRGLLGSYGSGKMTARDNLTVIEDVNAFGAEWQVLPSEEMLFHIVEGPQAPEKCFIPMASSLRRRLAESKISEEEAKVACSRVNDDDFDMCVFDVMATGDKDMVGAY